MEWKKIVNTEYGKIVFHSIPYHALVTSRSSGNAFVSEVEGWRFKSRAGQIRHSVANGSLRCDISIKEVVLPWRNDAEMGPANSLHASA